MESRTSGGRGYCGWDVLYDIRISEKKRKAKQKQKAGRQEEEEEEAALPLGGREKFCGKKEKTLKLRFLPSPPSLTDLTRGGREQNCYRLPPGPCLEWRGRERI